MLTKTGNRRKPPPRPARRRALETLGDRLFNIRDALGLTQAEVGDKLGCYPSNVSMFEHGHHSPSLPKLRLLAQLYGCSLDELTDVGGPYPGNVSAAHKG